MAEVATSVLHNVGNVLNSVNISASVVADKLKESKAANIARVADLMREHAADLGEFMTQDPRGRQLPEYIAQLAGYLSSEQTALLNEMESLRKHIEHIKDIVAMQQNYAKVSGVTETVKVADLVEDALSMNAGALVRHDVQLIREYNPQVPEITVEKHKVLQILVNLIRNAKYACDDSKKKEKHLTVRVSNGDDRVRIAIIDNGVGIPAENITRIFNHGFTTRQSGHGFGLHSGALAAKEMGGALLVYSDGPDKGATFTLELPLKPLNLT
jgi:signal transduction histidine kinase